APAGRSRWTLRAGERRPGPSGLTTQEASEAFVIDTGAGGFHVDRRVLRPLGVVSGTGFTVPPSSVELAGLGRLPAGERAGCPRGEGAAVGRRGPVRATVCRRARWPGRPVCRFVARLCFFAGTGLVRLRVTLHNPARARHKGGLWDLGDPCSVYFDALSLW